MSVAVWGEAEMAVALGALSPGFPPVAVDADLPVFAIRRARPGDVPAMAALLDEYARQGFVLPRTLEQVYRHMREYVVAVDGGRLLGCAGLRIHNARVAEVVGVAVAAGWQGMGVGRRLVETVIQEARELGMSRVFAMTLREGFFHRLGFRTVPLAEVPEKIAADRADGIDRSKCMKITVVHDLVS
jgi:amino-acid N-acetyltransferase